MELLDVLEAKWKNTMMNQRNINSLIKATWVLQRIAEGDGIGAHNDEFGSRKIAFVYYLTPDDWQNERDGGELYIVNEQGDKTFIEPNFNTLVAWDMECSKSPLHWVNTVNAPNTRPRISLVGFWNT
jgi:Rps23 Pro-64 3,4-dihydroxylase Tpa1-like proline 4-hydroxylase